MQHKIFGEIIFQVGWKKKRMITLFRKEYEITMKVQAYYEEDGITIEQENAYDIFCKNEEEKCNIIMKLMEEYSLSPEERFYPRTLIINRDGSIALLCDDKENPDDGIAVCIMPETQIVSQDEYL